MRVLYKKLNQNPSKECTVQTCRSFITATKNVANVPVFILDYICASNETTKDVLGLTSRSVSEHQQSAEESVVLLRSFGHIMYYVLEVLNWIQVSGTSGPVSGISAFVTQERKRVSNGT